MRYISKIFIILFLVIASLFYFALMKEREDFFLQRPVASTSYTFYNSFNNPSTKKEHSFFSVLPVFSPKGTRYIYPDLNVKAAYIGDLVKGDVYFAKNSSLSHSLASLTKLMTAVVVLDLGEKFLDEQLTILPEDMKPEGNSFVLLPGEKYKLLDILKAVLISSSNEGAEAISRFFGRERFISLMNQKAEEWHLKHTSFADPTGLSEFNLSTAQEIFQIVQRIYNEYPLILEITSRKNETIIELESGTVKALFPTHLFAGEEFFIGGKTGYTEAAGGNLVSVFRYYDLPVAFVVLGSDHRFESTRYLVSWFYKTYLPTSFKKGYLEE